MSKCASSGPCVRGFGRIRAATGAGAGAKIAQPAFARGADRKGATGIIPYTAWFAAGRGMDTERGPGLERPDGGCEGALPDLRAEYFQPLRFRRSDPQPDLCVQQPAFRRPYGRRGGNDPHQGGRCAPGDTTDVVSWDGERAIYASRARTLVDAVYDWSRFNSLPRAYEWIRNDLRQKRVDIEELVTITLRFGNTGTIRRMGALLEREGVKESLLRRLDEALKQTRSMIPWIPGRPKRGKFNRRWGVVLNEPT